MLKQSNTPETPLPKDIEVIDSRVNQQKAQKAWGKLQEETHSGDQTLINDQYTLYCIKNFLDNKISQNHYSIGVFPANSDPGETDEVANLILIQLEDGTFVVAQDFIEMGENTALSTAAINSVLAGIAASTKKSPTEEVGVIETIQKTREKIDTN